MRCLHHRLRKISLQDLKRRIAVQTAVRLHSVIEINKAAQLLSPVFRTVKQLFLMPHLHQGADNPFRLTVGLRTGNPGKLLTNPVLITGYTESMVGRAFIFRTFIVILKWSRSSLEQMYVISRLEICFMNIVNIIVGISGTRP